MVFRLYFDVRNENKKSKLKNGSDFCLETEDAELKVREKEYIPIDFNLIVPADMTNVIKL